MQLHNMTLIMYLAIHDGLALYVAIHTYGYIAY